MIVTLTPNPSIDRTLMIPKIGFNEVLRTSKPRIDWGGKGFNVSRALRKFGLDTLTLGWVGGGAGKMLEDGLNRLGIRTDFVWVEEETRSNIIAREIKSEWYIRLNEPGPHIPESAIEALLAKAEAYASKDDIWIASGSLPQDVPEDFYARLIKMLKLKGVRVFFDANGQALKLGIAELPYLVNPDPTEVEALIGFPIRNYDDAKRAALIFLRQGIPYAAITFSEGRLLLASQSVMVLASPPRTPKKTITGAGDALMAGLIFGFISYLPLIEIARYGAAYYATWLSHETLESVTREDITALLPKVEARVINVL